MYDPTGVGGTHVMYVLHHTDRPGLYANLPENPSVTLVYGILRLINFAHGDVLMAGCYFAFYAVLIFSLPWWISFPWPFCSRPLTGR